MMMILMTMVINAKEDVDNSFFFFFFFNLCNDTRPITVAARSQVWVYDRFLAGISGSIPAGGMDICLL